MTGKFVANRNKFRPLVVQHRQNIAHVCKALALLDLQLPAGPPLPSEVSDEA